MKKKCEGSIQLERNALSARNTIHSLVHASAKLSVLEYAIAKLTNDDALHVEQIMHPKRTAP